MSDTGPPTSAESQRDSSIGVVTVTPSSTSRAATMSARLTCSVMASLRVVRRVRTGQRAVVRGVLEVGDPSGARSSSSASSGSSSPMSV